VESVQRGPEGDPVGTPLQPRPRRDPMLAPFVTGLEIATMPQDNIRPDQLQRDLPKTISGGSQIPTGRIGLVADLGGWSYAAVLPGDGEDEVQHRSLVALVRGPRMVVEYFEASKAVPHVRGTFVASEEIDDILRRSEPKSHDKWAAKGEAEGDKEAQAIAGLVLSKVKDVVRDFRNKLKPPPPSPGDVRLPAFQDLARKLSNGTGPPPPPPTSPRPVSIKVLSRSRELAQDGESLRMTSTVQVSLSENFKDGDSAEVQISVQYRFVEDARVGQALGMALDLPAGFKPVSPGVIQGVLTRTPLELTSASDPYDSEWTVRLTAGCDLVKGGQEVSA